MTSLSCHPGETFLSMENLELEAEDLMKHVHRTRIGLVAQ